MDIAALLKSIESTGLATRIRDSSYIFPLIESTHVFGLAMVFGTIAIIDLRLLGFASSRRSFKRMASDTLKWTWVAFVITAATGALMFTTNASVYYHNFFFRTKMLMLVLAGINMVAFELTAGRSIHRWDNAPAAPLAGKTTAVLSLVIWTSIIFLGREIGFTTSRAAVIAPPPADLNFDNLFDNIPTGDSPQSEPPKGK